MLSVTVFESSPIILFGFRANSGSNTTRSVVSNMSSCGVMLDVQETYILFATVGFYDSSKLRMYLSTAYYKILEHLGTVHCFSLTIFRIP